MENIRTGVNKERLITLFEQLISIDSPSYGERNMCDFLKGKLSSLGIEAQEDDAGIRLNELRGISNEQDAGRNSGRNAEHDSNVNSADMSCGNLYAYIEGSVDLPPLLLSAHMDTVEPSRGKQMVIHDDGRITSKGNTVLGSDDCAGIVAILEALSVLRENNIPHRPLEILFTVAEEPYGPGAGLFDFSGLRSKETYVFDLSGPVGGAAYQAPAILSFKATFTGRSAHAGFEPEKGIHAIKAASLAASRISCGHVGDSTVNIGTITGGKANNIVPDICTFTGEIRSYSDETALGILQEIITIAKDSAAEFNAAADVEHTIHIHAYCTELSHPVVQRFESACKELDLPVNLSPTFGGSDHNHFAHHGINGLVVATAMNNCHSCEEYTTVDELERAAKLALSLILQDM